jgi:hypothetical protein
LSPKFVTHRSEETPVIERHSCWDHTYEDCAAQAVVRLEARVAALEAEDRLKTEADEACAQAAEAEIARLEARLAALTAALTQIARESASLAWANMIANEALDAAAGGA